MIADLVFTFINLFTHKFSVVGCKDAYMYTK